MKGFFSVVAAGLLPQAAWACSVCFTGREGFMEAFYATTLMLILLPPVILGSIGYFFYKNYKKLQPEQQSGDQQPKP